MANDEIDKELGDIQKDGDNIEVGPGDTLKAIDNKSKYLKNVLFVLLLAVIGLTLFGVSFKGGQKIFSFYKTMVKDSLQENVTKNSKEMPNVAADRKADEPVAGEIKSGVKVSVPVKIVEPASDKIEKVINPIMEKNIIQPAKKDEVPMAKAERPAAAAKPKLTVPDVKPAATESIVKPATKEPKPVEKKKAAAAKAPKTHKEYKVIAGSFSIKANADILFGELKANNFEPMIVQAKTPKGQLYRVIVGSYRSLSVAKTKIGELKKLGFQSFIIVE